MLQDAVQGAGVLVGIWQVNTLRSLPGSAQFVR